MSRGSASASPFEVVLSYEEALPFLEEAYLVLFRGSDILMRRLITTAGRGVHCHAGMLSKWGDQWFVLDMGMFTGGRAHRLEALVAKDPGRWDVFEICSHCNINRFGAAEYMRKLVGTRYGFRSLLKSALLHLPFIRFLVKPQLTEERDLARRPTCSQAYANACRIGGGVDVVPFLADGHTEPADLARSMCFRYLCTLV